MTQYVIAPNSFSQWIACAYADIEINFVTVFAPLAKAAFTPVVSCADCSY